MMLQKCQWPMKKTIEIKKDEKGFGTLYDMLPSR